MFDNARRSRTPSEKKSLVCSNGSGPRREGKSAGAGYACGLTSDRCGARSRKGGTASAFAPICARFGFHALDICALKRAKARAPGAHDVKCEMFTHLI